MRRRRYRCGVFILSKLFWIAAAPGNLALVLLIIGVLLLAFTRWRWLGGWLAGLATVGLTAMAVLPLGIWMAEPLENRFPQPELPARVDGIVVLGGSSIPVLSVARGQPALNGGAERLVSFVELARRYPAAKLLFTGGSGSMHAGRPSEAADARAAFIQMGFDPVRVIFEDESRNTQENVAFSRRLAQPQPGETWLLVTSAKAMPRAVGVFRRAGWPVLAWPVDYGTPGHTRLVLDFDMTPGVNRVEGALHEWIGLVAYRILGRTDALFPSAGPSG